MLSEADNIAVIKRFYEEVFNQGREEVIDEIISPDYQNNLQLRAKWMSALG